MSYSILCTICMRSGSKGVKNKNIKLINNKPLMYYTIKQALKSKIFNQIVVSTDSKKIVQVCQKFKNKISISNRPKRLSSGNTKMIDVIKEFSKKNNLDKVNLVGHSLGGGISIKTAFKKKN